MAHYDPFDYDMHADPFPTYERMRDDVGVDAQCLHLRARPGTAHVLERVVRPLEGVRPDVVHAR